MKVLFDLFPVLLFFVAFKLHGVFAATAAAIAASALQVSIGWVRHRRVETVHLITLGIIVVLGGATLLWHDETFIKWKPTAVYWLFGLALLGSHVVGCKTVAERLMGASLTVPGPIWSRLNLIWAAFFLTLGFANLYVAYHFATEAWVNFKVFGMTGLTIAFAIAQAFYLVRHIKTDEESQEGS